MHSPFRCDLSLHKTLKFFAFRVSSLLAIVEYHNTSQHVNTFFKNFFMIFRDTSQRLVL
nr:MAG TPA: hypothetical protein [Bacteriophage sp.]